MVTRSDVEMVYRVFLHREPETDSVVTAYMQTKSVEELCRLFLDSQEFRARFGRGQVPLDWPPITVQTEVTQPVLAAMLARVEGNWNGLGDVDPYWSVISIPAYRRDSYTANADQFRETGRFDTERLAAFAARAGVELAQFESCLELGCGVGRITRWLARIFPRVIAADVSQAHLAILRQELPDPRVHSVLLRTLDALDTLPPYDAFFSVIVLQHNPPPVIAMMLRRILDRLRPGGIGYFQVPTYRHGYAFDAGAYLDSPLASDGLEMHALPQDAVFAIAASAGCTMLEVREDGYTGETDGISNTFFLQKR